jgi:hypothetical protein
MKSMQTAAPMRQATACILGRPSMTIVNAITRWIRNMTNKIAIQNSAEDPKNELRIFTLLVLS